MDPRRKKQISILLLTLVVLALLIYGFWPRPIPVDIAVVEQGPLRLGLEEEGKTQVRDRYTMSVPVSGVLERIRLEAGDSVAAGEVTARLLPLDPQMLDERQAAVSDARLKAALAGLEQAQERLRLAEEEARFAAEELSRVEQLFESRIGSEQELDRVRMEERRAESALASARFGARIAEHEVASARAALERGGGGELAGEVVELRSPVDGRVFSIDNRSGRTVVTGQSLMEIGDLRSLEVRVDLLSSDAVRVRLGTPVLIKRWGGEDLTGKVRLIEPAGYTRISALGVEEQRVPVLVDFGPGSAGRSLLGDGYRVVVEFILWEGDRVLRVPTSALFRSGGRWAMFLLEGGRAVLHEVEVGHQSGFYSQILGGVREGDLVLTHPDERIADGTRVTPRR